MASEDLRVTQTAGRVASHIFLGTFISYVIAFAGTLVIARLLNPSEFGLVAIAFFVPNLVMITGDFGVTTAVTKHVAESVAKGDGKAGLYVHTSLVFDLLIGLVLTLASMALTPFLSQSILLKPQLIPLAYLASPLAVTIILYNLVIACVLGLGEARLAGIMMPVHYAVQYSLGPLLFILGLGVQGIVIGYVIGPLASALLALGLLWRTMPPRLPSISALRTMLSYGMPLSGVSVLSTAQSEFLNLMVGRFASTAELGYYAAATRLSFISSLVTFPIGSAAFPAMSQLYATSEEGLRKAFQYSVKFLTILWVPMALWIVILSNQVIRLLFGQAYVGASFYLILYALVWLYAGGGDGMLHVLMQSSGDTWYLARRQLYDLISGVAIGLVLIPFFGVVGLLLTLLLSYWPGYLLLLRHAGRTSKVRLPLASLARVYVASVLASVPVILIARLPIQYEVQLLLSAAVMVPAYALALAKLKAVDIGDLVLLENSLSGVPYAQGIARIATRLMRRLL